MNWRLSLDVPLTLATEPGYARAVHCSDFRGQDVDYSDTWHDPVTGLLMLKPSFLTRGFYSDFKDIAQFDHNSDFWLPSSRAVDNTNNAAPMMSSILPAGQPHANIAQLVDIAIIAINAVSGLDELVWALQSKFMLAADEALCIHYHGLSDEMLRYENWFTIHWDTISVNISQTGTCRVYRYDSRTDLTTGYHLVQQFDFASPGDLVGSYGYFYLQPIPGYGLLFHHSRKTPRNSLLTSNGDTRTARGHLIPWPAHTYDSLPTVFEPSKVTIGVNPHMPHLLGYQSVTFPGAGTYTDAIFDPGYPPSSLPSGVQDSHLAARQTSCAVTLRTPDDADPWGVGLRQARAKMTLSTSDARYTPFVTGYFVGWSPAFTTRTTTALQPTKVLRLEFTEDEMARLDGRADLVMATSAERAIVERGDTTWLLEKSADGGVSWGTVNGGLAKVEEAEAVIDSLGFWYRASLTLMDLHERLREVHAMHADAFDGQTLPQAFSDALISAGFAALASYPSGFSSVKLPLTAQGQQWRLGARENDDADTLTETFLLYGRSQNVEYQLIYDWGAQAWKVVRKPRDMSDGATWTLTAYSDEHAPSARSVRWSSLRLRPEPPEANLITVIGVTSLDSEQSAQVQSPPIYNQDSLTNAASPDYLGRVKPFAWKVLSLSDQGECNIMARRIAESVMHRRLKSDVETSDYVDGLTPNTYVAVRAQTPDGTRATLFNCWVKRRTVVIEEEGQETMALELDTVWEGELPR